MAAPRHRSARAGSLSHRLRESAWLVALLLAPPGAIATPADELPSFDAYGASPALAARAQSRGIPLSGLLVDAKATEPAPDDAIVCLVVLEARERRTEWLLHLRGPTARAEDSRNATELYAMDGRPIRFPGRRERYSIVALGPHPRSSSGPDKIPVRVLDVDMRTSFLDASMLQAADFIHRTGRARLEGRLGPDEWFTVLPTPPDPANPAARERFVIAAGMTDTDERAVTATVPVLNEFARVIAETPGLRDVLFAVVPKPSLWSIVSRFGRLQTDFRFRSGEVVPLDQPPGFAGLGRCFIVPFTFSVQGKPALHCTMLVVDARPPLRMCAGIVALVATSAERPDVRLVLSVLATRSGRGEAGD